MTLPDNTSKRIDGIIEKMCMHSRKDDDGVVTIVYEGLAPSEAKSLIMELISKEKAKSYDIGFSEGQISEKVKPEQMKPLKTVEEILNELGWAGMVSNDIRYQEAFIKAKQELDAHYYQLILSLVDSLEYNSKLSRSYFQPTINSKKNHKNGYRLAVRDMKAKLSEHFNREGEV